MDKYSIDFESLGDQLNKKKSYRLEDVKDKIEKVAFDVVRFRDNQDTNLLWKIENTNEGPVIMALYDEDTGSLKDGDWSVIPDKKIASVHVFYKGEPIAKVASSELGIPDSELETLARWLPEKLQTSVEIQSAVLQKVAYMYREDLVHRFPELKKAAAQKK